MTLHLIAEWYTAVLLIVTGLSHITAPRPWAEFFRDLLARPWGGLVLGLMYLIPSLPLLLAHNIWALAPSLVVTLLAWGWTIKGSLYLICPSVPGRVASRHLEHPGRFRIAGVVPIALGGIVLLGMIPRDSV